MSERLARRDSFSPSHTLGPPPCPDANPFARHCRSAQRGVSSGLGSQACANVRVQATWRRVRPALVVHPDQGPVARCGESGSARFPSYLPPPALPLHTPSAATSSYRLRTRLLLGPPRLLPAKVSAETVSLPRRDIRTATACGGGGGSVATSGLRSLWTRWLAAARGLRPGAGGGPPRV